jgi:hypothetical protein
MTTPLYIFNKINSEYLYLDNQRVLDIPIESSLNQITISKLQKTGYDLLQNGVRGWELTDFCFDLNIIYENDQSLIDHVCGQELRLSIINYINKNHFSIFFARNIHHEDLHTFLKDRTKYKDEIFQS